MLRTDEFYKAGDIWKVVTLNVCLIVLGFLAVGVKLTGDHESFSPQADPSVIRHCLMCF